MNQTIEQNMSNLSDENKKIIDALLEGYQKLSGIEKSIFPDSVKKIIKEYNESEDKTQSALNLIDLILRTNQKSKFSCLKTFYESPLVKTCNLLKTNNLSTSLNISFVIGHSNPLSLYASIRVLSDNLLLLLPDGQKNVEAVIKHLRPDKVANAIISLRNTKIINDDNLNALAASNDPSSVVILFKKLASVGIFSGAKENTNRTLVVNHPSPAELVLGIETLQSANLWENKTAQVNFDILQASVAIFSTANAIITLTKANLLDGEYADANRSMLKNHKYPGAVAASLIYLNQSNLLEGSYALTNRNAIASHPLAMHSALLILMKTKILNQENFDNLIKNKDILLNEEINKLWEKVPNSNFTQEHFNEITNLCKINPTEVITYFNEQLLKSSLVNFSIFSQSPKDTGTNILESPKNV